MNWSSVSEFFAMGGYALYVWGGFGVCALAMIFEPIFIHQRHQRALKNLQRHALIEQLTSNEESK